MQFEEFDKKVREAAEHHHPSYNEGAWSAMEKSLDKHMPQEKDDRRRIFFILFFFLLLGGGLFWFLADKGKSGKDKPQLAQQIPSQPQAGSGDQLPSARSQQTGAETPVVGDQGSSKPLGNNQSNEKVDQPVTSSSRRDDSPIISNGTEERSNLAEPANGVRGSKANDRVKSLQEQQDRARKLVDKKDRQVIGNAPNNQKYVASTGSTKINSKRPDQMPVQNDQLRDQVNNISNTQQNSVDPANKNSPQNNPETDSKGLIAGVNGTRETAIQPRQETPAAKVTKEAATNKVEEPAKKDKKQKAVSKRSPLFFTLSTGPDLSSVGSSKTGDVKLLKGVGAGYTFRDRLTIRSGFYIARKIYTAAPDDYKPGGVLPSNWRYLTKVDADCKVYEVPVQVSWNIIHSSKRNVFAGAGVSSYFMKTESYDYYYKYPSQQQPVSYNHSFKNTNNHYFAVLGLSAGYQQHLTPAMSISAEPYLKLPLKGVGAGHVKLKSAGVMISAIIQPFKSRQRKPLQSPAH